MSLVATSSWSVKLQKIELPFSYHTVSTIPLTNLTNLNSLSLLE